MTELTTAGQTITDEVTSWQGIEAGYGRRGEFAFKLGRREVGHIHGNRAAHFFFPKQLWHELYADDRIEEHPVFPGKIGPAARRIETDADVDDVIALMRLNYERLASGDAGDAGAEPPPEPSARRTAASSPSLPIRF